MLEYRNVKATKRNWPRHISFDARVRSTQIDEAASEWQAPIEYGGYAYSRALISASAPVYARGECGESAAENHIGCVAKPSVSEIAHPS